MGLLVFFAFDEVLLIILFSRIGFPAFSVPVWLGIGAVLVGLNFLLALVIYRLIQTRPKTGIEGLAGQKGVVLSSSGKRGKVRVRGESWDADFSEELRPGDEVTVNSLKGLVLVVEPASAEKDE
jgi:membrane protein implicated in regulation of membrane protease activity